MNNIITKSTNNSFNNNKLTQIKSINKTAKFTDIFPNYNSKIESNLINMISISNDFKHHYEELNHLFHLEYSEKTKRENMKVNNIWLYYLFSFIFLQIIFIGGYLFLKTTFFKESSIGNDMNNLIIISLGLLGSIFSILISLFFIGCSKNKMKQSSFAISKKLKEEINNKSIFTDKIIDNYKVYADQLPSFSNEFLSLLYNMYKPIDNNPKIVKIVQDVLSKSYKEKYIKISKNILENPIFNFKGNEHIEFLKRATLAYNDNSFIINKLDKNLSSSSLSKSNTLSKLPVKNPLKTNLTTNTSNLTKNYTTNASSTVKSISKITSNVNSNNIKNLSKNNINSNRSNNTSLKNYNYSNNDDDWVSF